MNIKSYLLIRLKRAELTALFYYSLSIISSVWVSKNCLINFSNQLDLVHLVDLVYESIIYEGNNSNK